MKILQTFILCLCFATPVISHAADMGRVSQQDSPTTTITEEAQKGSSND